MSDVPGGSAERIRRYLTIRGKGTMALLDVGEQDFMEGYGNVDALEDLKELEDALACVIQETAEVAVGHAASAPAVCGNCGGLAATHNRDCCKQFTVGDLRVALAPWDASAEVWAEGPNMLRPLLRVGTFGPDSTGFRDGVVLETAFRGRVVGKEKSDT